MKPIIGVIGRPDTASDNDHVICMWESIREAIIKKGGLPHIIIPNQDIDYENLKPSETPRLTGEEIIDLKRLTDVCDGLILPGGYKWYQYDEEVYKYAVVKNMPILGICLGMQMMCKIDNETKGYIKNVANDSYVNHHDRDAKYVHNINIVNATKLKSILSENYIAVNSKHNYHVSNVSSLRVSAYSEDGYIEAVEYQNKDFCIGVQWHPETMLEYDENANKIFDEFINAAKVKTK